MKKLLILLLTGLLAVSVISAQTTYKDGDAYIGEDDYNPNWIWDFVNLWSTLPKLGVENDFVWNDDTDNPAGVGQCISLPNNHAQVCLDSLTNPAYYTYTFEFEQDSDLSEADPSNFEFTSVPTFYFHTNKANGFKIGSVTADKLWLYLNGTVVTLYYENSMGKTVKSGILNSGSTFGYIGNNEMIFSTSGGYYYVTIKSSITSSVIEKITFKLGAEYGLFDSLGDTKSLEEAGELAWERSGMTPLRIGTKDEDHKSMYGTIIRNPKMNGASDQAVLEIPDEQVKAKISIKGTSPSGISGGITHDVPLGVSLVDGGFSNYLSSADLPSLIDSSIIFNSETIDVHDSLEFFNGGPTVETSLTSNDDDYKTDVFLELKGSDWMKYYYYFDEYVDLKKVSSTTPLNIKFLGQDLKITAVPENAKIVVGGEAPATCTDSDSGKNYYVKGTTVLGSEVKTDSCTYCTGYCAPGKPCNPPTCGGVVEYYCENNLIKSEEYVCPNNCNNGACITDLNDIQITACKMAHENNNCDKLLNIGLVTAEQCCTYLKLCCSPTTITTTELKDALIKAIKDYFVNQPSTLTVPEIKDLIVTYLAAPGDTVDLSGTGQYSGEKLIDIYNKAKNIVI